MEQSDKHAPRIDDSMSDHDRSFLHGSPVDSRVREDLRDEGNGPRPGQPSADAQPSYREPGTSEGLDADEVARRAELATYIEGHVFPAHRDELLASAEHMQAPVPVIDLLKKLPPEEEFDHFQEVWEAVSS